MSNQTRNMFGGFPFAGFGATGGTPSKDGDDKS
jgi:hypothetical protein